MDPRGKGNFMKQPGDKIPGRENRFDSTSPSTLSAPNQTSPSKPPINNLSAPGQAIPGRDKGPLNTLSAPGQAIPSRQTSTGPAQFPGVAPQTMGEWVNKAPQFQAPSSADVKHQIKQVVNPEFGKPQNVAPGGAVSNQTMFNNTVEKNRSTDPNFTRMLGTNKVSPEKFEQYQQFKQKQEQKMKGIASLNKLTQQRKALHLALKRANSVEERNNVHDLLSLNAIALIKSGSLNHKV